MDSSADPSRSRHRTHLPSRLRLRSNGTDHLIPSCSMEYTSLRDIVSPRPSGGDVVIRHPLVQHAANAYLQIQSKESPCSPPRWPLLPGSNHENDIEDGHVGLCSGLVASLHSLLRGLAAALRGRRE